MNPWDIRAALFARHAQHVVLIHFPIALFLAGVALDLAATWTRRKDLAVAAPTISPSQRSVLCQLPPPDCWPGSGISKAGG